MTRLLAYARQHVIALLALVCSLLALAGSSYAAFTISGSQIRNRSIDAVKLNPKTISASVRAWAIVYAGSNSARVGASSSRVHVNAIGIGEVITWPRQRFGRNCMASVSPQAMPSTGGYSVVTTQFDPSAGMLTLHGFGPNYAPGPQAANVMIICP